MKVGSLVECIKESVRLPFRHETLPVVGCVYTVREIEVCPYNGELYLRFEEIVNPKYTYLDGLGEYAFAAKNFRELQSPEEVNLSEIAELQHGQPLTA